MQSKVPLAIGIVGAGAITRKSHLPVLMNTPGVAIAWIYDHRPESAKALADAYGLKWADVKAIDHLPACDAALLAIPIGARTQYLKAFAARGTAVLCEKPFAMNAAEHSHILDQFEPHALGAGYMRRFFGSSLLLRRIVREGMFGPLRGLDVSEGGRSKGSGADASFLDDPRLGATRGVLTDLGSHTVDLALYISAAAGFDVISCDREMDGVVDRKVTARMSLYGPAGHPGPPVDMTYAVSWLDRQDNQIRLRFAHTTVWSALGPASDVYVGDPTDPGNAILLKSQTGGATTYNQAFYLEWQHFLDGLRTQSESLVSGRSALLTTSAVEALLTCGIHR
jgi:predicted dehydrogenase